MKTYTVTIDCVPENKTFTAIISIVREYDLPYRSLIKALEDGAYKGVVNGKCYVVMETELIKSKRKFNKPKTK